MTRTELGRAAALELAAAGWEVLPLQGKIPRTRHGVKDATTDPRLIERWWPRGTRHNVGARVPARLVVLDFDPQNGGTPELFEQLTGVSLPATLTVHSGRGTGGQHRYYLHPGGALTMSRLRKQGVVGVDIKTSTGYCVMPPSLHPSTGKPYWWELHPFAEIPARLVEQLRPAPVTAPRPRRDGLPPKASGLFEAIRTAPVGDRNDRLYWAARRALDDGQPPQVLDELEHIAVEVGLPPAEARAAIRSAIRGAGGAQ